MKNIVLYCLFLSLFAPNTGADEKFLFLGDSLTEGYQLSKESSYPSLIEKMLQKNHSKDIKVLNGGVSGSTTASGMSRLRWFMKAKPTVLVLALGGNDGLRGFSLKDSYSNLEKIISYALENKLKVLLCGMKMPPNYGAKYQKGFEENFTKLAKKFKIPFYPFLLVGVGGNPKLNLADGIHPNEEGYKIIAANLYKKIKKEFL